MRNGVLIYGGTFNPVHIGHLRVALEVYSRMNELVDKVEFVPANIQPLKNSTSILPFKLRCKMLESALQDSCFLSCNKLEGLRPGPSYTYDTLAAYPGTTSKDERYFLLGSEDFKQLPKWYKGSELLDVCNLVVVPRTAYTIKNLETDTRKMWPALRMKIETLPNENGFDSGWLITLHNGGKIYYYKIPFLEISSTAIRAAWLNNQNITWLVPPETLRIINFNRRQIMEIWGEASKSCSM